MSRILLIGPGAIGGSVAAWLCEAGHDVTLAVRTEFSSLTIETPAGETIRCQPKILHQPSGLIETDWVPVAVLQNGVEHVSRFSQSLQNISPSSSARHWCPPIHWSVTGAPVRQCSQSSH